MLASVARREPAALSGGVDIQPVNERRGLWLELDVAGALFIKLRREPCEVNDRLTRCNSVLYPCGDIALLCGLASVKVIQRTFEVTQLSIDLVLVQFLFIFPAVVTGKTVYREDDFHADLVGFIRRPAVVIVDVFLTLREP